MIKPKVGHLMGKNLEDSRAPGTSASTTAGEAGEALQRSKKSCHMVLEPKHQVMHFFWKIQDP